MCCTGTALEIARPRQSRAFERVPLAENRPAAGPGTAGVRGLATVREVPRSAVCGHKLVPGCAAYRHTPRDVYDAKVKAHPVGGLGEHFRVRHYVVDTCGKITVRYQSKLRHIGMGARFAGEPVVLFIADAEVRVVSEDGALLRELTLDPALD